MTISPPTENDAAQEANDHIYSMLWGVEATKGAFRCECGRPFCTEEVFMGRDEYVRLRDREELIHAPGHEGPSLHDPGHSLDPPASIASRT